MSEENKKINQPADMKNNKSRIKLFLNKVLLLTVITAAVYVVFEYSPLLENKKIIEENFADEIVIEEDLEDDYAALSVEDEKFKQELADELAKYKKFSANESRQETFAFIAKALYENKANNNYLRSQIHFLKNEFFEYKSREGINKMIFAYIDLRQKIFATHKILSYQDDLYNFEMLTREDKVLQNKISEIRPLLERVMSQDELRTEFDHIISDLLSVKYDTFSGSFLGSLRDNIAKLVVIRKVAEKNSFENGEENIEEVITRVERLLKEQDYKAAIYALDALSYHHHTVMEKFLNDLEIALEVQEIDREILSYLKTLS